MSSPFASRLGTNYSAQDKEIDEIKALLVEPCQKLKNLDDEIDAMRKALDKLTEERNTLSAYVEAHKALLSPFRRLPRDVIEAIFMACLPTHRNCVMSAQEAPVILGRICSSWRIISHSFPRLWSSLHIVEPVYQHDSSPSLYQAKLAQRLEVADIWLRRSGTCSLSISLHCPKEPHPWSEPPRHPRRNPDVWLNVLLPFASRWKHIRLVAPTVTLAVFSHLGENDVPLLRRLEMAHNNHYAGPEVPNNSSHCLTQCSLLRGPNLSNLSVFGNTANPLDLPLRWSQFTDLTLIPPSSGDNAQTCEILCEILYRCPKLQNCKLFIHNSAEGNMANAVIECSFLHTLELLCSGIPLHTFGRLLRRLSLPALRDFKVRGFGHHYSVGDADPFPSADSLLSSFGDLARLESISVDRTAFPGSNLINFLRSLPPTVRRLDITEPMVQSLGDAPLDDDDVFAALEASLDRPSLFPALEELVICHCRDFSDEALLRLVISRVPTLKLVDVQFDREMQVDILPSLEPFAATGLKTSITYIPASSPSFSPWIGLPDGPPMFSPYSPSPY
ncbi:hypothetical protein DFH08DRAFT_934022 [Mycena albidolilacea]|uniref:F-box domain-containing protein n=1 Tax=Mycena albidolilacea TaxID=1033008 RepID=A0AAD7AC70_9AGAR|nr:hypothetical protein DFH08DRAFT_934022 [Mycena albidolilacea]